MRLSEIDAASTIVRNEASPEAEIIVGAVVDDSLEDELMITVIASGFENTVNASAGHRASASVLSRDSDYNYKQTASGTCAQNRLFTETGCSSGRACSGTGSESAAGIQIRRRFCKQSFICSGPVVGAGSASNNNSGSGTRCTCSSCLPAAAAATAGSASDGRKTSGKCCSSGRRTPFVKVSQAMVYVWQGRTVKMICPFCGENNDKVLDSRASFSGYGIRRRRECLSCGQRFSTLEQIEGLEPTVVKKDGSRQPYSESKILRSLAVACSKRPVTPEQMNAIAGEAYDL